MKRFYCTECRRVKRVQKWPHDVQAYTSINVMDRIGTCNWHDAGQRVPVKVRQFIQKTKPVVNKPAKQARKRA
jgi:hypothetical protein